MFFILSLKYTLHMKINSFPLCLVVMATLLAPLAAYHRAFQHVSVKLEPVLQRLDFSVTGYMMAKPIDNQCKKHSCVFAYQEAKVFILSFKVKEMENKNEKAFAIYIFVYSPAKVHSWCGLRWSQRQWRGTGCILSNCKSMSPVRTVIFLFYKSFKMTHWIFRDVQRHSGILSPHMSLALSSLCAKLALH